MRPFYHFFLYLFFPGMVWAQTHARSGIRKVKCSADTLQQYAFYLPEKYSGLMIFLDPAARGELPLDQYAPLADEYGIIMAGSCNSRNFDISSSIRSFVAIYNDVTSGYAIDPEKVWVAGFSGGARAASALGSLYPEVKAVIGCGAGFAGEINFPVNKMYAAISGTGDMNFSELLENSYYLDSTGVKNTLITFNGGHVWPPFPAFGLAIEWLIGMTDTLITPSDRGDLFLISIRREQDSGHLYTAWFNAGQLARLPAYHVKAGLLQEEITADKRFKTDSVMFLSSIIEEQGCMNDFSIAFSHVISGNEKIDDDDWVKRAKTVREIKEMIRYRQQSAERCFDHCTRSCREYYYRFSQEADYKMAFRAAGILSFFIPDAPEAYYLMAKAEAATKNKRGSEKMLKEAVKRGLVFSSGLVQPFLALFTEEEIRKIFAK